MFEFLAGFYAKSVSAPPRDAEDPVVQRELRRRKWSVFFAITFGYGFYYVCRLTFSVAKKSMADAGLFDAAELGLIGSGVFFAYAFGKLANGILADRVNTRRFMSTGLFVSGVINFTLGYSTAFSVFLILWALNGWFQSFGAASSVVTITHWYDGKERGTFYGMWASSHNIGEAITFVGTAVIISTYGWMWGFRVAGVICILASLLIWRFLYERPEVHGLPSAIREHDSTQHHSIGEKQLAVFKNPAVWILGLSSASFYVTRYAINSWGVFFLEAEKGYSLIMAGQIVAANAVAGIFATFFSGILSDRFFGGRRNVPALLFGIIFAIGTAWFVLGPANLYADFAAMVLFGLGVGALMVYLGGLMAVDICSKDASGAALGAIGVASYIGAGIQDVISGRLINDAAIAVDGQATIYNFEAAGMMWIGSAVVSLVLALFVWNAKSPD